MIRFRIDNFRWIVTFAIAVCALAGCGTTRWTDTSRTGTEQLLISDSAERAISEIDFSVLAGRSVYLETKYVITPPLVTSDQNYIISTFRQHMIACGCQIKDKADDADFIVEIRTGAIGTNRNDLLFGVPPTNLPTSGLFPAMPSQIPEIALAKRTAQQGVVKVAAFAYERKSGQPVWQSGTRQVSSKAKDTWILGTGPWQKGTIYDGTKFAGERLIVSPLSDPHKMAEQQHKDAVWVAEEIKFDLPTDPAAQPTDVAGGSAQGPRVAAAPAADTKQATPASHTEPVKDKPAAGTILSPTNGAASAPTGPNADAAPAPLPFSAKPATPLAPAK